MVVGAEVGADVGADVGPVDGLELDGADDGASDGHAVGLFDGLELDGADDGADDGASDGDAVGLIVAAVAEHAPAGACQTPVAVVCTWTYIRSQWIPWPASIASLYWPVPPCDEGVQSLAVPPLATSPDLTSSTPVLSRKSANPHPHM